MNEGEARDDAADLMLEYELDAPPEKVWRAICIPELRDQWLPAHDFSHVSAEMQEEDQRFHCRITEKDPPFVESIVTFEVSRSGESGSRLTIRHSLVAIVQHVPRQKVPRSEVANSNQPRLLLAA